MKRETLLGRGREPRRAALPRGSQSWVLWGCDYFLGCLREEKGREAAQSCPTLFDPMDCSLPGSSIHRIFQARVLEWGAISFSRGSSQPRDWTQVSRTVGRRFTVWATREVLRVVLGQSFWLRVLPDGTDIAQPRWVPARRVLGAGRITVSFSELAGPRCLSRTPLVADGFLVPCSLQEPRHKTTHSVVTMMPGQDEQIQSACFS